MKQPLSESVEATYKDGSTQIFETLQEAADATNLTINSIKRRCGTGAGAKSKDGITFKWADEYTRRVYTAKHSRNKGHSFELEIVNKLKEIGYTGVTSSRRESRSKDNNKIDITDTEDLLPVNIQAKYTQKPPNYYAIEAECSDKTKPFCIAWKKATDDGTPSPGTLITMPIEYFYELIRR